MNNSDKWDKLPTGVLTDRAIIENHEELFNENFDRKSAIQSHYECSIGARLDWPGKEEALRTQELTEVETFILRPFETVVVCTNESFLIPHDCVARFLLKGKFFGIGIAPINTYADAGFDGRMSIVLNNSSHRHIKISRGDKIAKVEFEKLSQKVDKPYNGQHGYGTEEWIYAAKFVASNEDLKNKKINPFSNSELAASYGDPIADMHYKITYYTTVIWIQMALFLGILILALTILGDSSTKAIFIGIAANLITGVVVKILPNYFPSLRPS